jgi:hypothetical protein
MTNKNFNAKKVLMSTVAAGLVMRHLGMGACFHGNFFAIFLMFS